MMMALLLLIACGSQSPAAPQPQPSDAAPATQPAIIPPKTTQDIAPQMDLNPHFGEVIFKTNDGVNISGTLYGKDNELGVILVPMIGKTKDSYKGLVNLLEKDYKTMPIDLRGHGKSQGDITKFTDGDYMRMPNDVKAAAEYLKKIGVKRIAIVGASIGANAALQYAVKDENVSTLVLISPGESYHGLDGLKAAGRFARPALVASGTADKSSMQTAYNIEAANPLVKLVSYSTGAHGTDIFSRNLGLQEEIVDWLAKHLKR